MFAEISDVEVDRDEDNSPSPHPHVSPTKHYMQQQQQMQMQQQQDFQDDKHPLPSSLGSPSKKIIQPIPEEEPAAPNDN